MTALHQILAIQRGVTADADRKIALAIRGTDVTGAASPLSGLTKTYRPREEDGVQLPGESKRVQIRVEKDVLPAIAAALTRLLDVNYTREQANTEAFADVTVDGTVLLEHVPAGYLLYLETQLNQLRALLARMPVLDPAEDWTWDANRNVYATTQRETVREIKIPQVQVIQAPQVIDGKPFDGQYRTYETTKPVGFWTTVSQSGALPAQTLEDMLDRVGKLGEAVKQAREEANTLRVTDMKAGDAIFRFVLTGSVE